MGSNPLTGVGPVCVLKSLKDFLFWMLYPASPLLSQVLDLCENLQHFT